MITMGLVTCARSDFGLYLPLIRAIGGRPGLTVRVIATGMHLSPAFGMTVDEITTAGVAVHARVESVVGTDRPEGVARSIGRGVEGFADLFAWWRPDILLVLGDRFDMFPAALAALPHRIPVAHIGGGELTEGTIDDALRHSLTKLSHLHFVATETCGARVRQLGEQPWRVVVTGALGLDHVRQAPRWPMEVTAQRFGFDPARPIALITYHPVTLEHDRTKDQIEQLLAALDGSGLQCLFTAPNADTGWTQIMEAINAFCHGQPDCHIVPNAGQAGYVNLMRAASVMVGNSSSGLIEAPAFRLPVVNVGTRQAGRERAAHVIDCGYGTKEIRAALHRALSPEFRAGLAGRLENPYGDGNAAERIADRLAHLDDYPALLRKTFVSVEAGPDTRVEPASHGEHVRWMP